MISPADRQAFRRYLPPQGGRFVKEYQCLFIASLSSDLP
jgi:hypothetical protein